MSIPVVAMSEILSVAPQLRPEDMAAVAQAGFRSVIINRPDLEGGPEQPLSADVLAAADAAGLEGIYQPVISGALTQADAERFAELVQTLPQPILAFCRSGTRCSILYRAASEILGQESAD